MNLEIIDKPLVMKIHGFAGIAINKEYAGTAFKLMDKMWQVVKSNNLKNKGLNIWVYEPQELVFAGVELNEPLVQNTQLEEKNIRLIKYVRYLHTGPYSLIKQAVQELKLALHNKGLETCLPYMEIYGHWTNDESKLETELFFSLK
jgi:effector-binding domain-containing protein